MSKEKNISEKVRAAIEPAVTEAGYLLWDVSFAKEGPDDTLFVVIDRAEGIDLDDCARVTHLIDPILDETDPIPTSYYLEVSSAGMERVLKTEWHFQRFIGQPVTVKLFAPLDKKKEITGVLESYNDGVIVVDGLTLEKGAYSTVKTIDTTSLN